MGEDYMCNYMKCIPASGNSQSGLLSAVDRPTLSSCVISDMDYPYVISVTRLIIIG